MFIKLQIGIVILFVLGIVFIFGKQKRKEKPLVVGLVICTLISAFMSNAILGLIPLPTNEVIVTALGEKNEAAKKDEVSIISYLVDGKEYEINNPTEGKWFWKGDTYMWRNESDSRQPAGTTRSITLNIPYGKDRYIQFGRSQWNGLVAVTYDGETTEYDSYKHSDETILYAAIPDTNALSLYAAKFLRLILFFIILAILELFPVFYVLRYSYHTIKNTLIKYWDKFVYLLIAGMCLRVMFWAGKQGSFWIDELWNLGWIYSGWPNPGHPPVIYSKLCDIWFAIMPYGQEYLLLLSEILVAASIYFFGLIGEVYRSKRLGIIMSALAASSITILAQCGGEFRPYALLLFSVTLALYFFIKKQKNLTEVSVPTLLLYSIALVVCMDTHQFGVATAGLLMIFDFVLLVIRKIPIKGLIEFIFPTIYGTFWICTKFLDDLVDVNNFSIATSPTLDNILDCIVWLCGVEMSYVLYVILVSGVVAIIVTIIKSIIEKNFDFKMDYIQLVVLFVPTMLISFNFIYSAIVNPENSLWIHRYFVPAIPFFLLIIGLSVEMTISFILKLCSCNELQKYISASLVAIIVICLCTISWNKLPYEINIENDYKGAANYLLSENEIYDPSTLCYVSGNPYVNIGFEYYLSQNGEKDSINHVSNLLHYKAKDFTPYNVIYVVIYKNRSSGTDLKVQDLLTRNNYVEVYNNNHNNDKKLIVRKWVKT